MSQVSYETFSRASKFFQALRQEEIAFTINFRQDWINNTYQYNFVPSIDNLDNLEVLGKVFANKQSPVPTTHFKQIAPKITQIIRTNTAEQLTSVHEKVANGGAKFVSVCLAQPNIQGYYITARPYEEMHGKDTYRVITETHKDFNGYDSRHVICVNQEHPAYNYLDQHHVIFFIEPKFGIKDLILITNQLTLDVNYLVILYSLYPGVLKDVIQNEVFLNAQNSGHIRMAVAKAEKALPERYQEQYRVIKAKILQDFEKNAQNVLMGKLARNEIGSITLNDIKITATTATYETITIEAADFRDVVFKKVDPNQEWDIFTLIGVYSDHIEELISKQPTDEATGRHFVEAKTYRFKVNGFDVEVATNTTNTRRKINGYLINKAEVGRVLKRASCHHDQAEYNAFVKQVSKLSLYLTDVLAQGLPVKTYLFDSDRYNQPATRKHPKLRFKRDKGKFHLLVGPDTYLPVKSVMKFINKVNAASRRSTAEYGQNHEGKYVNRNCNSCERELKIIIPEFVENTTPELLTQILKDILKERIDAEEKSAKLLADVAKLVGAERIQKNNVWGWKVQGKLKTYFVEEDTLKTFDNTTNAYVCIVNGKGDSGVGHDALVTRLLALKNDSRVTHKITTLR